MRQKRKKETTTVPFSQSKTPRKNFSFLLNDHWFTAAHSRYTEEANYHWEDFTMDFSHLLTDIRRRTSLNLSVPWFALNLAKKKSFSSLTTKVCHARKKPPPQRSNDSTAVVVVGVSEVSYKCCLFIFLSLSFSTRSSLGSLFVVQRREKSLSLARRRPRVKYTHTIGSRETEEEPNEPRMRYVNPNVSWCVTVVTHRFAHNERD